VSRPDIRCSNEEVCTFAREKFGARFLLLDKLRVNGAPGGVAPLYQILKAKSPNFTGSVSWNFEKFLVDCNGHVLRRYKPGVLPEEIRSDIEFAIKHPGRDLPSREKPLLGVD
jgi:glutathione peroxidase